MQSLLTEEQRKKITVSELARLIFTKYKGMVSDLPKLLEDLSDRNRKATSISDHDQEFFLKFYEAIDRLKHQGLVMDVIETPVGGTCYKPSTRPTSVWDKSSLDEDGGLILVDDAEETVRSLERVVSGLDPVVRQYYLEGLRACQKRLYISSVVCLGGASERLIGCLVEAVADRYPEHGEKLENIPISAQIDYLSCKRNFGQIFGFIEDDIFKRDIKERLSGIAHIYRRNRNEAGHPRQIPMNISRDEQASYLYSFHRYAVTITKAIEILKSSNP